MPLVLSYNAVHLVFFNVIYIVQDYGIHIRPNECRSIFVGLQVVGLDRLAWVRWD